MRHVGHRRPFAIFEARADKLIEGAGFNDEIHGLPTGETSFIPKGVYRFKAHAEANRHWLRCVAEGMARMALERRKRG